MNYLGIPVYIYIHIYKPLPLSTFQALDPRSGCSRWHAPNYKLPPATGGGPLARRSKPCTGSSAPNSQSWDCVLELTSQQDRKMRSPSAYPDNPGAELYLRQFALREKASRPEIKSNRQRYSCTKGPKQAILSRGPSNQATAVRSDSVYTLWARRLGNIHEQQHYTSKQT